MQLARIEAMSLIAYKDAVQITHSLSYEEKLRLMRELAAQTEGGAETNPVRKHRSILELQGMGADIWQGIDAQEYVDSERSSWRGGDMMADRSR